MPIAFLERHLLPDYPRAFDWFEYLSRQPVTEIICWNLVKELINGYCQEGVLDRFLTEIDSLLRRDSSFMLKDPKIVFRYLRQEVSEEVCLRGRLIAGDSQTADCCFKIMVGSETYATVCRLMDLESFIEYSKHRRPVFLENPSEGISYDSRAELNLTSRAGFLFVTRKPELDEVLGPEPYEDQWKRVLELLGLTNLGNENDTPLKNKYALVEYPPTFSPFRLCQPTYIEGGEKAEFRIRPLDDGWNQTVDLGEFSDGDAGLPEAVHCPFGIAEVQYRQFEVSPSKAPDYHMLCDLVRITI